MSLFYNFLKAAKHLPMRASDGRFMSGAQSVGATGKSLEFPSGSKSTPKEIGGAALKTWKPPSSPAHDPNAGWRKTPDNPNHDPHPLVVKDGKKAASGVIIHEPDGRVWLTKPTNSFGGYKYTLPKGSAEHDLTLQQNAVKEAYEETGLHVQITGHAGDYERDTSVGRYYHAKRIGGHPGDAGWESEAVTLAHPDDMHSLLNRSVDQQIAHDHAGAPKPPQKSVSNKENSTWWNNFKKEHEGMKAMTFREALASTSSLEIAKKFNPQQPRGKGGKWVKGGAAFTAAHTLSSYKQDHPQVKSAHKFIGHVESIVNHGAMSHAQKLSALSELKVPKGANLYQKAKVDAFEQAHAHLAAEADEDHPGVKFDAAPEHLKGKGFDNDEPHEGSGHPQMEAAPQLGLKKISGKLGSNEGGIYENGSGQKFYVKTPADPDMAKSEVLASKLYQAMGVKTLNPELTEVDGKTAVATEWKDGIKTVAAHGGVPGLNAAQKESAQKNFAAHVLLGNWDAAGTGHDNQGFEGSDHKAITLDGGGSLEYRAQGGKKGAAWNGNADEWDSLRDAKVNQFTHSLFGGMTASQLKSSAETVKNLSDDKIKSLVEAHGPGDAKQKEALAQTLIQRKAAIVAKADALSQSKEEPKDSTEDAKAGTGLNEDLTDLANKQTAALQSSKPGGAKMMANALQGMSPSTEPKKEPEAAPPIAAKKPKVDAKTLTPPALPAKLDASKLTSKANASKKLLEKNDAIHQIGQDYAKGKIKSDEAQSKISDIQSTLGKKQHYHQKLNAHAEDVKAAIASHASSGKAAAPLAEAKEHAAPADAKGVESVRPKVRPFDPNKLQEPPSFKNWGGQGKSGPSAIEHINQNNEDSVQKLYAAAKTGDADAVKNTKLDVLDKATGAVKEQATYDQHPSQHVKSFGHQMVAEIDHQKNPPKVFKPKAGSALKQIHEAFPTKSPKALAPHEKIYTKYVHLGHVDKSITNEQLGIDPAHKLVDGKGLTPKTYQSEGNKAWESMSTAQRSALKSYTGGGYADQNAGMWSGNPSGQAKAAESALNTYGHTIKPGTVLSRYIDLPASDIAQIMKGKHSIIQEPAIMSTSVTPTVWAGNTHLKLTVGNGVKGIYAGENSTHPSEHEMILPPNSRLLITHVENTNGKADEDGFGGKNAARIIHATILPNGG